MEFSRLSALSTSPLSNFYSRPRRRYVAMQRPGSKRRFGDSGWVGEPLVGAKRRVEIAGPTTWVSVGQTAGAEWPVFLAKRTLDDDVATDQERSIFAVRCLLG